MDTRGACRQPAPSANALSSVGSILADAATRLEEHIDVLRAIVPVVEPYTPVRQLRDGCRCGAVGAVPARGKHYCVARATKAAVEHQLVAGEPVAGGRGVGFRDAQP